MWTCASAPTARSATANAAPLAELVEAVLRRDAHRDAREPAGELAVEVGVDEVRVQDRRALRGATIRDEPREGDRVDVARARRMRSSGTPRARAATRTPTRPARPRGASRTRTSQPRSRSSGSSSSRWVSEPEIPATFGTWRTTPSAHAVTASRVEDADAAHDCDRVARATRSREPLRPTSPRARGRSSRERARIRSPRGAVGVVARGEAKLVGEERVEDRVRGEHRQAGRGGLVDDLVGRARAHVVDERVDLGERPGTVWCGAAPRMSTRSSRPSSITRRSSAIR